MTETIEKTDFKAVNLLDGHNLTVTWDVGRRCNYDCTYCPAHRHDNFSPHASLETLQDTAKFVFEYGELLTRFKTNKRLNLNFTGGEPTVNPNFLKFGEWLRDIYKEQYKNKFRLNLTITSNGAFSRKMADSIIENYGFITISYHAEAHQKLKKQVVDNIYYLTEKKFPLKTNVMFHAEYFEECKDLCLQLDRDSIGFVPRLIGEHEDSHNSFAHKYTDEQLAWFKEYWANKNAKLNESKVAKEAKVSHEASAVQTEKSQEKKLARELGRPCCGSRTMEVCSNDGEWKKSQFLEFAKFRNWHCSVNWFFLHIEQQTDTIWHHQTCQARFDGTRGPIGSITENRKILDDLRTNIENNTMPVIQCPLGPGKHCGCGLCVPKATEKQQLFDILPSHLTDMKVFG
jgi:sulfatase maturation enzyme AslB (radical SAM superfamily)